MRYKLFPGCNSTLKCVLIILASVISSLCSVAQGVWNGKNLVYITDAFSHYVPVGTAAVVEEVYGATKRFGHEISLGSLKETKVYEFDEHGFYTNDGESTYENNYYDDGRIKERNLYENGKFAGKWIYEYVSDGIAVNKYNADGQENGVLGWSANQYVSVAPGGGFVTKLNKDMREVSSEIQVTNYRQEVRINQVNTYNDHGCPESTTISGLGRVQNTNYSDYEYDDYGTWIARFSEGEFSKRTIYDQAGYAKKKEDDRIEAERKEKEKRESQTKELKQLIQNRGYAIDNEIQTAPVYSIQLNEPNDNNSRNYQSIEITLPDCPETLNFQDSPICVNVESPAIVSYPNGTTGQVPYKIKGKLIIEKINLRTNDVFLEVKLNFDKKNNKWYIKNRKDLINKKQIPEHIVEALDAEVIRMGETPSFNKKKIYIGKVYKYRVKYVDESSLNSSIEKKFPIRFELHDKK